MHTMKNTATAAEVREQFLITDIEEAASKLTETLNAELDYDASIDLLTEALESIPEEELKDLAPIDKMAWAARQCYLAGFIAAFKISAEAATQGYNVLFDMAESEAQ